MALVMSPENRMPPSAISGTPVFLETGRQFMMAVNCGTPTPATMRVVQMEPGPMPILTPSTPALIRSSGARGGADVAGDQLDILKRALQPPDRIDHVFGVPMGGVDQDDVRPRLEQGFGALLHV